MNEFKPKKIIIGSSIGQFDHLMYYRKLLSKSVVLSVPHFFICKDGSVHNLIEVEKPTKYSDNKKFDDVSLTIELENAGCLYEIENNEFVDEFGTIYNNIDNVFKDHFRGGKYWDKYTKKQLQTLNKLLTDLCYKHNIVLSFPETLDTKSIHNNIVFRTNITNLFKDVNKSIYGGLHKTDVGGD